MPLEALLAVAPRTAGELGGLDLVWVALAAAAAGLINALAGGGSLISFPALTALGLPAVMATVCPGLMVFPSCRRASSDSTAPATSSGDSTPSTFCDPAAPPSIGVSTACGHSSDTPIPFSFEAIARCSPNPIAACLLVE